MGRRGRVPWSERAVLAGASVDLEDVEALGRGRHAEDDLPVEAPRPAQRRVHRVRPVRRPDDDHLRRSTSSFVTGIRYFMTLKVH